MEIREIISTMAEFWWQLSCLMVASTVVIWQITVGIVAVIQVLRGEKVNIAIKKEQLEVLREQD